MGPLSYPILRIGPYGKGPMNSTDDPYFSTLVGPRTHCFQFVKISLHDMMEKMIKSDIKTQTQTAHIHLSMSIGRNGWSITVTDFGKNFMCAEKQRRPLHLKLHIGL